MTIFLEGRLLTYKEIQQIFPQLRQRALNQLLNRFERLAKCSTPEKLWGDEIEFMCVKFLHSRREVKLLLRAQEARHELLAGPNAANLIALWSPEQARFQAETAPLDPFGTSLDSLVELNINMQARRHEFRQVLRTRLNDDNADEDIITMSLFPLHCSPDFTFPSCSTDMDPSKPFGRYASICYPHQQVITNDSPIFVNTMEVSQDGRGGGVCFHVPIFRDKNTPKPFVEDLSGFKVDDEKWRKRTEAKLKPDTILVDTAGFGLGGCSMQITQQATNIQEAAFMFDQLSVLCPIMLAMTAASPIVRGFLANYDSRWLNFCNSVDARTPEQRGSEIKTEVRQNQTAKVGLHRLYSIETYVSEDSESFNDVPVCFDREVETALLDKGVPPLFARYVAHMMVMSPKAVTDTSLTSETDHTFGLYTSIQDFTNWSIMRLKFPILDDSNLDIVKAGFRVEFRPMDLQSTSFENVAFLTFIRLLTLTLCHYRLDLRVPISKLFDNILTSVEINACKEAKFHWRRQPELAVSCSLANGSSSGHEKPLPEEIVPLTIKQIMLGSQDDFIGLLPLVRKYIELQKETTTIKPETSAFIERCLEFIEDRATGKLPTKAQWTRTFVHKHPAYKHDSVVPQSVVYDLLRAWQLEADIVDGISHEK